MAHQYLRAEHLGMNSVQPVGAVRVFSWLGCRHYVSGVVPGGLRVWGFPESQNVPKGPSIYTQKVFGKPQSCSEMGNSTLLPQPKSPASVGSGQAGTAGAKQCCHFSESLNYKDVFILLRIFFKTPKKHTTDVGKTAREGGNKRKRRGPELPSYVKTR